MNKTNLKWSFEDKIWGMCVISREMQSPLSSLRYLCTYMQRQLISQTSGFQAFYVQSLCDIVDISGV